MTDCGRTMNNTVLPRRSFVKMFALFSAAVGCGGKGKALFVADVAAQSNSQIGLFRLNLGDFPDLANLNGSIRLGVPGMPSSFYEIIITRGSGNSYFAVSSRCPHQGCVVEPFGALSSFLECPCHGSRFDPSGTLRRGPAGSGLTKYTATVEGEKTLSVAIPNLGYTVSVDSAVSSGAGPRLKLDFPTITGLQYELRFRSSLSPGDWAQAQFSTTAEGPATETVLNGNNKKATVYVDRASGDAGLYAVVRY